MVELTGEQRHSVLTVCVMAAFADGGKSDAEREQVRAVAASLARDSEITTDLPAIVQNVLLKRVSLSDGVAPLIGGSAPGTPDLRTLAYEMAVVVCDADGVSTPAERAFLDQLRAALGLEQAASAATLAEADDLAEPTLDAPHTTADSPSGLAPAPASSLALVPSDAEPSQSAGAVPDPHEADVDAMILKYAVLNGALELMPQNLATLAILPMQTKMVYRIGKRYGHTLDRRSIAELLSTLGMGATSQMLENVARKFIGRFGKTLAGGMGKQLGKTATGAAFSFASTWAIGQLAKRYYRSGRSIALSDLKAQSAELIEQGRTLFDQQRGRVEQESRGLDAQKVWSLVRGQ